MKAKSSYIQGWSQKEWGGKGAVIPVFGCIFEKKLAIRLKSGLFIWLRRRVVYALPQFLQSPVSQFSGSAPDVVKITRQNAISCL